MALSKIQSESINLADDFAGMHFGGTGSANQFDDYETGTWTGTLEGGNNNPSTAITHTGQYTKVGNLVFAQWTLSNVNTLGASGAIRVTGLPFTADTTLATGNQMLHRGADLHNSTMSVTPYIAVNNEVRFYSSLDVTTWQVVNHNPTSSVYIWFSVTYTTAA